MTSRLILVSSNHTGLCSRKGHFTCGIVSPLEYMRKTLCGPAKKVHGLSKQFACSACAGVLAKYSRDLTELAREGKLDPVVGRHGEMRRLIDVLGRRTKNRSVHSWHTLHGSHICAGSWRHALNAVTSGRDRLLMPACLFLCCGTDPPCRALVVGL